MKRIFLIFSVLAASLIAAAQNNPFANPLVWGINAATSPIHVGESTTTTFSVGNNGADPIPAGGASFNVSFPPNVTVDQSSLVLDGGDGIFAPNWDILPGIGTFLRLDVVGTGIPAAVFMGPQWRFDMTVTITGAIAGNSQQQTLNAVNDASIAQNLNPGDDNANGPVQVIAPLPVTLESFTGELTSRSESRLDWKVSSAMKFSHFDVERSTDGIHFSKLQTVNFKGRGTYQSFDRTIATLQEKVYYRLNLVDQDGTSKHSNVVALQLKGAQDVISLFPNPAGSEVTIKGLSGECIVDIYSIEGRLTLHSKVNGNLVRLNVSTLAEGSYIVNITDQHGIRTRVKLIKK